MQRASPAWRRASQAPVTFQLSRASDGWPEAVLTFVGQGDSDCPADTVTIKARQIQLEIEFMSAICKGTLGDNGEIAGQWSQGPHSLPLTFKRTSSDKKQ